MWVTRPERPKAEKDEAQQARRTPNKKLGPTGPYTSSHRYLHHTNQRQRGRHGGKLCMHQSLSARRPPAKLLVLRYFFSVFCSKNSVFLVAWEFPGELARKAIPLVYPTPRIYNAAWVEKGQISDTFKTIGFTPHTTTSRGTDLIFLTPITLEVMGVTEWVSPS